MGKFGKWEWWKVGEDFSRAWLEEHVEVVGGHISYLLLLLLLTMRTLGIIFIVTFYICVLAFVGFCLKPISNEFWDQLRQGFVKKKGAEGRWSYEMAPQRWPPKLIKLLKNQRNMLINSPGTLSVTPFWKCHHLCINMGIQYMSQGMSCVTSHITCHTSHVTNVTNH